MELKGGNMKRKTTGILISCVVSICCMVVLSMSSHTHDVYASYSRYVTANNVVVRKKASNKGKIVGSYKKAAKVRCYKKKGSYTKIKYGRYYRYIATRYLSKKKPVVVTAQKAANITTDTYTRYVTASSLTIRKKASTSAAKAGSYKKGTQITCYGERSGWTTVRYSGVYCYVSSQYLSESKPEEDTWETYGTATGQSVVDYAMQFRGNPYVWGGESLTNGVDCSGFTMQVYKHFGYSLPHSSTAQRYEGTAVSWNEKQPGDLICYQVVNGVGHVAIYIGDNQIIHAGSKDTGINVRNADYRAVWGVRRIVQ